MSEISTWFILARHPLVKFRLNVALECSSRDAGTRLETVGVTRRSWSNPTPSALRLGKQSLRGDDPHAAVCHHREQVLAVA
jgi:hypothetical protein